MKGWREKKIAIEKEKQLFFFFYRIFLIHVVGGGKQTAFPDLILKNPES
jgi:hypothetical protein